MYEGPAVRLLGNVIGAGTLIVASAVIAGKVSSVQRKIIELEREAYTDHLTGLKNRRASEKRLQEDLLTAEGETELAAKGRPRLRSLVVVTADLDGLKKVNDRYGHEAGDRYLQAFASLLKANLRAEDCWAGRMGGDEFIVSLWEAEGAGVHDKAYTVISRLVQLTRNTIVELPGGNNVRLSASFGAARYERGLPEFGRLGLYKQADLALLQAKRQGKDRIVYA